MGLHSRTGFVILVDKHLSGRAGHCTRGRVPHEQRILRRHRPDRLRRPRVRQPAGVPVVRRRSGRRRQDDGRAPAFRGVVLALVQFGGHRHLRRRDPRSAVARSLTRSDGRCQGEDGRGVRVRLEARRAVLLLPRPRHRARGLDVRRVVSQLRRDGRPRRRAPGTHRRASCCGAPPTCSRTRVSRRAPPRIPIPISSATPQPRSLTA